MYINGVDVVCGIYVVVSVGLLVVYRVVDE